MLPRPGTPQLAGFRSNLHKRERGSSGGGLRPAAWTLPGNLLEMRVLRPQSQAAESEIPGVPPAVPQVSPGLAAEPLKCSDSELVTGCVSETLRKKKKAKCLTNSNTDSLLTDNIRYMELKEISY